jgi:hypothetical protein
MSHEFFTESGRLVLREQARRRICPRFCRINLILALAGLARKPVWSDITVTTSFGFLAASFGASVDAYRSWMRADLQLFASEPEKSSLCRGRPSDTGFRGDAGKVPRTRLFSLSGLMRLRTGIPFRDSLPAAMIVSQPSPNSSADVDHRFSVGSIPACPDYVLSRRTRFSSW